MERATSQSRQSWQTAETMARCPWTRRMKATTTLRCVESDRLLAGQQVVVEAVRVGRKELGTESESIASEGLEGHWEKAAGKGTEGEKMQ
jgi:hypothetical protein